MQTRLLLSLCIAGAVAAPRAGLAAEDTILTIYNQSSAGAIDSGAYTPSPGSRNVPGYAVVRQMRTLNLPEKENAVVIQNVPSLIDPPTVQFRSLTDPVATRLIEQSYRHDLGSRERLLDKYINKKIGVEILAGDKFELVEGNLLSTQDGLTLKTADGVIKSVPEYASISFPELPELVTIPTLIWNIVTNSPGEHQIEVTYQTLGMGWGADYNLIYHESADTKSDTVDISAWASITNHSGAGYRNAGLKLVAGDVQHVATNVPGKEGAMHAMVMERGISPSAPAFAAKSVFEYHSYTLNRPVSLMDNSTTQIELIPRVTQVPVEKMIVFAGADPQYWNPGGRYVDQNYGLETDRKNADVYLKFQNKKESGLGAPLPAGRMRISQREDTGDLTFIGESIIDHTPRNEEILVRMGSAFDVVGERTQRNYVLDTTRNFAEEEIEIIIRNQKKQPVQVKVIERLYRTSAWAISNSSHEYEKESTSQISFPVNIDPEKEETIKYTVRYTW